MSEGLPIGSVVKCPRCGREGKVVEYSVRWGSKLHVYLAVQHPAIYGRKERKASTARCILRKLREEPLEKPLPAFLSAEPEKLRELEEENERLRQLVAQLQAENEQLRMALVNVRNAKLAQAGERERLFMKLVFKDKRSNKDIERLGLSPAEVRSVALSLLDSLLAEDWVAVRASVWLAL